MNELLSTLVPGLREMALAFLAAVAGYLIVEVRRYVVARAAADLARMTVEQQTLIRNLAEWAVHAAESWADNEHLRKAGEQKLRMAIGLLVRFANARGITWLTEDMAMAAIEEAWRLAIGPSTRNEIFPTAPDADSASGEPPAFSPIDPPEVEEAVVSFEPGSEA